MSVKFNLDCGWLVYWHYNSRILVCFEHNIPELFCFQYQDWSKRLSD